MSRLALRAHLLLVNRPKGMSISAIANGCGLSIRWLTAYASKTEAEINGAGVARVEKLYEYMSGKTLSLD